MNNSEFIQDTTLSLDYLADDFNNLPEIQDGVSEEEIKAAEQIANLDYGSVVTIADDHVDRSIGLVWGAMPLIIQFLQKLDLCAKTGFWYDKFQDRQMNSDDLDFDWLFVNK